MFIQSQVEDKTSEMVPAFQILSVEIYKHWQIAIQKSMRASNMAKQTPATSELGALQHQQPADWVTQERIGQPQAQGVLLNMSQTEREAILKEQMKTQIQRQARAMKASI